MRKSIFLVINVMVITILMSTLYTSCKKSESTKSAKEILTSKKWRITKMEITPPITISIPGLFEMNLSDSIAKSVNESCAKDDFITFTTDGKTITDEGALKCDATAPQTSTDDYVLSADEKKITLNQKDADTGNVTPITFDIAEISESSILLTLDITFDYLAQYGGLSAEELDQFKSFITLAAGTKMKMTFTAI